MAFFSPCTCSFTFLQLSTIKERNIISMTKSCLLLATIAVLFNTDIGAVCATTFVVQNNCTFPIWPAIVSNRGLPNLANGGFTLQTGQSISIAAPSGWQGRFWSRTGCKFDSSGHGSCATGDCDGKLECDGNGRTPATLAEFTLVGANKQDFYDASLVDGYNLPLIIVTNRGNGNCSTAGCTSDLNRSCPPELRVQNLGSVIACRSACDAFNEPQYCCTGMYSNPQTCPPTKYSRIFKDACPSAYSYAYDDASSLLTCTGADYTITFCPQQLF